MVRTIKHITRSAEETQQLAREVAIDITSQSGEKHYVCLVGDLGSGKTTFAQGFARGLGILGRVQSPTFLLLKEYDLASGSKLYHLDLYSITSPDQIHEMWLTIEELRGIILIEWADRLADTIHLRPTTIHFHANDDQSHTIAITHVDTLY